MIKLINEQGVIDLTNKGITFIEENPLFYNYLIKGYSKPFSLKKSDHLSRLFNFIDLDNIANFDSKYKFKLQIDNIFVPACVSIEGNSGDVLNLSMTYGFNYIELLDTSLRKLPFPVINTDGLTKHAKSVIPKKYPEVGYNFPMIIDEEFKSTTNYEKFEGMINNYNSGGFITNYKRTEEGEEVIYNRNLLTPFPYIKEVLRVGFESAGLRMSGDFFEDEIYDHLIWDTGKYIEQKYSPLPASFQFTTAQNNLQVGGDVVSSFSKGLGVSAIGSYSIKVRLSLPDTMKLQYIDIKYKNKRLYLGKTNKINTILNLNVESPEDYHVLTLEMKIVRYNVTTPIPNIESFNSFNFWSNDGRLNEYPDTFSLADVMPNITFSTFLKRLKTLNLAIDFSNDSVSINYVKNSFLNYSYRDHQHLEVRNKDVRFNKNKVYILKARKESLYIDKSGLVDSVAGYDTSNRITVPISFDQMEISRKHSVFTARRKEGGDLRVLLYDGLQDGYPVAVSNIDGRDFSLQSIYSIFWKDWLRFRLNSATIKDQYSCGLYENLTTKEGIFKYNNKQILKKVSIKREGKTLKVSSEGETIG